MSYGSHLPLNHRAHPKFLPKRTTERILKGLSRMTPSRRECPQSPQKPVGRTSHQEQRAVRAAEHRGHDIVMGDGFPRPLRRNRILKPPEAGGTAGSQGTLPATRGVRQADDGAQVHYRECRLPTLSLPHQARGHVPKGRSPPRRNEDPLRRRKDGRRRDGRSRRGSGRPPRRRSRRSPRPSIGRSPGAPRAPPPCAAPWRRGGRRGSRRPGGGSSRGNSTRVPPTPSGRCPTAHGQGIPHPEISGESVRSRERRFRPGSAEA